MKLHTKLTDVEVSNALWRAQQKGLVGRDVYFTVFTPGRSLSHPHGYEIMLGSDNRDGLPAGYTDQNGHKLTVRRVRNSNSGEARYSATWHEWGWLIREIFDMDPEARWGQDPARSKRPQYIWGYSSVEDFHEKTNHVFEETS